MSCNARGSRLLTCGWARPSVHGPAVSSVSTAAPARGPAAHSWVTLCPRPSSQRVRALDLAGGALAVREPKATQDCLQGSRGFMGHPSPWDRCPVLAVLTDEGGLPTSSRSSVGRLKLGGGILCPEPHHGPASPHVVYLPLLPASPTWAAIKSPLTHSLSSASGTPLPAPSPHPFPLICLANASKTPEPPPPGSLP